MGVVAGVVRVVGGYGAEVVGPEAALWAGARILRRAWGRGGVSEKRHRNDGWLTLIIQLETWLMLKPVAWHNCFFSSSLG